MTEELVYNLIEKMKLLRVGNKGKEKPAALDTNSKIRDLRSVKKDLTPDNLTHSAIEI